MGVYGASDRHSVVRTDGQNGVQAFAAINANIGSNCSGTLSALARKRPTIPAEKYYTDNRKDMVLEKLKKFLVFCRKWKSSNTCYEMMYFVVFRKH